MSGRDKQRIICTPDAYERVRDFIAAEGYGDRYIVSASTAVPPGKAIILQSDADFEAHMQQVGEELHADLLENLTRRFEEDSKRLQARLRYEFQLRQEDAFVSPMARSPFGVVTGL